MLCKEDHSTSPGCSDMEVWKKFWRYVWSVRVPHKTQQFLWRVSTDSLLTLIKLQRRGIIHIARCCFCQTADEDAMHALWTCPELLSVWVPHTLARKLTRRRYLSLLDVLSDLFMLGTVESIAEFCFTLWLLWNRRNKALYRNEFDPLCSIPQLAASLSSEFLEAHKTEAPILPAPPTPIWKPPSHCAYKINFDAALSSANVRTGVGVIIRDGRGLPIATLCKRFQCCMRLMMRRPLLQEKPSVRCGDWDLRS
jgi:hypothetical protein